MEGTKQGLEEQDPLDQKELEGQGPLDPKGSEGQNPSEPKRAEGGGEKKYTDDEVNKIIAAKFSKWEKEKAKELDKLTQAQKLAQMSEEERLLHEKEALEKELEEFKRLQEKEEMSKVVENLLKEREISAVPSDLLKMLVSSDAESTKGRVEEFASLFKLEVERAVKERLKGAPPTKGTSGGSGHTKEQILQVKDPIERQKLIAQNMNLFQK